MNTMNLSIKNYVIGFVLSLVITLSAIFVVFAHLHISTLSIAILLALLAVAQIGVQLVYFLHITQSRERLYLLICALGVVCILVGGSLWIMFSLQGRMMPDDMQMQYMDMQGGL
jgi:cytochrome o ubiquinol oxidase operon protein cyoD